MSIASSVSLVLLLCLSMHACDSRPLGKHSAKRVHHSVKTIEKVESSIPEELNVLKGHEGGDATESAQEKRKVFKALTEEFEDMKKLINQDVAPRDHSKKSVSFRVPRKKQVMELAGREVIMLFEVGLRPSNLIEGLKRRALTVLGSGSHRTGEEAIDSKEHDVVKDVLDMDYEPPHRRAPIHNLSAP